MEGGALNIQGRYEMTHYQLLYSSTGTTTSLVLQQNSTCQQGKSSHMGVQDNSLANQKSTFNLQQSYLNTT